MHGGFLLTKAKTQVTNGYEISFIMASVSCVCRYILASHQGDTAHPEHFRCSSLEVKDLKGQNSSQWQLSSILPHAAVKAKKLSSYAFVFVPDLKAEKGTHA